MFSASELIPSEWTGNYTCPDDNISVIFVMNITRSDKIDTTASFSIQGHNFSMSGAYASQFKFITLQSDSVITETFVGRNFTDVELNGKVQTMVLIDGFVIFTTDSGTLSCPVVLRRTAGKIYSHFSLSFLMVHR
jgi:hypothetical protein